MIETLLSYEDGNNKFLIERYNKDND